MPSVLRVKPGDKIVTLHRLTGPATNVPKQTVGTIVKVSPGREPYPIDVMFPGHGLVGVAPQEIDLLEER